MTPSALLKGIALGLGAAVPIGPVNVEIIRRSLRTGPLTGFALGCGAVTVDVGYAVLTTLGIRPLLNHPALLKTMGFAAAALLTYLGLLSLRSALQPITQPQQNEPLASTTPSPRAPHHYATGLAITSLNPMTLLFWFIAVPGAVGQITTNPRQDLPIVCIGVFIGALTWITLLTTSLHVLRKRLMRGQAITPWVRTADLAGGLLLLTFAAATVFHASRLQHQQPRLERTLAIYRHH